MRSVRFIIAMSIAVSAACPAFANETVSYTYDALGRLVQVTHSGSVNNGVQTTYTHDPADNRNNVTTTGASH